MIFCSCHSEYVHISQGENSIYSDATNLELIQILNGVWATRYKIDFPLILSRVSNVLKSQYTSCTPIDGIDSTLTEKFYYVAKRR